LTFTDYNFRTVFSLFKPLGIKLIPLLMLMCSFAYSQNANPSKSKKPKPKAKKTEKVMLDSSALFENRALVDSLFMESLEKPDPMDTVKLRRSKNALKSSVKYTAKDSIVYSADKKVVYLYGDAKVFYQDLSLKADFIKIELDKSTLTATYTIDTAKQRVGVPKFKQGSQEYTADRIAYNYQSKRGFLSEFKTKEGEGFVRGKDVMKNEDNEFGIKHSTYTTCDADTPHFYITANKLKVIPEKKVVGLWPNLVIEGVSTPLIFPFAIFPLKKGQSSGIVIPTYGNDNSRGIFLRGGGYYFGLGDHADLQLTGDIYSNTSWGEHTVFKYSNRYHYSGNLVLNYAQNQYGLPEDPGYRTDNGFEIRWMHMQDGKARPGSNFSANVNIVSNSAKSGSYLSTNSYNPTNIISNQMNSSISFSKSMKNGMYNFTSSAGLTQNLTTHDINVSLPNVNFSTSTFYPFKSKYKPVADKWYENITANYSTQFRNEFASKDTLLFVNRSATEFNNFYDSTGRFGVMHTLPVQTSFKVMKYFTLSARVTMNDYWYFQTIRRELDTTDKGNPKLVTRTVNGFQNAFTYLPSLSLNTKYYGMKLFKSGPISAIRHVVSPTVGLSYSPDFSDPKYGYYRTHTDVYGVVQKYTIFERGIFGYPGAGKQGNLDFGVDNNLEVKIWKGKDTARKEEKITLLESFRIGGAYNFFADSLKLSMLSISARTRLFKNISINTSSLLDPYVNVTDNVNGYNYLRRINTLYFVQDKSLGIIKSANVGLSASFNQDFLKGKSTTDKHGYEGEKKYINDFPSEYLDFNIPWTLTLNYTVGYDKYATLNNPAGSNIIQTLYYSGDFNLTKKWKIAYMSGYDIKNMQPTITSINITRDLHCWEFKFDWIPFGPRQSFLFTIHAKSSVLQDLKQTKRREWYDRTI